MIAGKPQPRRRKRLRNPYDRRILALALPAFGALIAEPVYILADTAVVGHLGTTELAGLAIASSILLALYSIFIFLAYGTTAAVSRLLGAGDQQAAVHQAVQSMWLAVVLGVALAALGWFVAEPLTSLMGATGAVREQALIYLHISLFRIPAMLVVLAGTGYLRGLQDTRTPLVVATGTAVFNLVLEVGLIYGFGFGIGAAALSTVLAQGIGAAFYMHRLLGAARSRGANLAPHLTSIWELARVGLDLLVRTIALRGALTVATAVAARMGPVDVAAHQIGWEIWAFAAFTLDALAIAGQAMVGRALGAGDATEARDVSRRMIELGIATGIVAGLVLLLTRGALPYIFTSDDAVIGLASFVLLWVALSQPVNAVAFVLDGVLIGAGDQRFLAKAMVALAGLFAMLAFAVAVTGLGIGWLWAALTVLMVGRAVSLTHRFRSGRWVTTGPASNVRNRRNTSTTCDSGHGAPS